MRFLVGLMGWFLYVCAGLTLATGLVGLAGHFLQWLGAPVPFEVFGPLLVPLGYFLNEKGLGSPWVDSGGGLAWLTPWGVLLMYVLPGVTLFGIAYFLRRLARK